MPVPLLAHAHLVKSLPANGTRVSPAPTVLRLWFSETPELALTHITLLSAKGDTVPLGAVVQDSASVQAVAAVIPTTLIAGTYRVRWNTAAADGHPSHGEFTFTVLPVSIQGATPVANLPVSSFSSPSTPTKFDVLSSTYIAIRWLSLMTLVIVIGIVSFRRFVTPALARIDASFLSAISARTAQFGLWTAVVLGFATLARLTAQLIVLDHPALSVMLLHTTWGVGWLVQAVAVIVTTVGFVIARQLDQASTRGWTLATGGAIVLALTPALSGHAIATPNFATLAVLSDGGHVLAAGGWLGSLVVLATMGLPALRHIDPTRRSAMAALLVNRFSVTALTCATLVLITGAISAWLHLGMLPALWQTTYGQTLLIKLGVLALVAIIGAYHWRVARPSLERTGEEGVLRLHRSAMLEIAIGAVVIAVTAVLIGTPTPVR